MQRIATLIFAVLSLASSLHAQERVAVSSMQLSAPTRDWIYNPDGSCVQCSIVEIGIHCNDPAAYTLLWDTAYGPAVRGGSWPDRVADYCNRRHIRAYNVTGASTIEWCRWATKTGRFAAIGCGQAHFQTLWGYDYSRQKWLVNNNQTPRRIDEYSEDRFRQAHYESGPWVVILQRSSSENPQLVEWWR